MNNMNDNHESDEGPPIASLAELDQEVSPQFLGALRKKIYRRTATNQMVSFSWNLPKVILMEMIMLIGHLLSSSRKDKRKS
jgi:hypothetical protein